MYVPPAHVLSSVAGEGERQPLTYPVPALPFTNHTATFTGVIDYIWYTTDDFRISGVLGGYFYDGAIGRDLVRWIGEGQRHEDKNRNPATPVCSLESHPSIPLVHHHHPPVLSDTLVQPSKTESVGQVWSIKGNGLIGFPNPAFPSDHIPVMCELLFQTTSQTVREDAVKR